MSNATVNLTQHNTCKIRKIRQWNEKTFILANKSVNTWNSANHHQALCIKIVKVCVKWLFFFTLKFFSCLEGTHTSYAV